jgi:hypothetical protein
MKNRNLPRALFAVAALCSLLAFGVGCSSDSPSEPSPTPAPPGGGGPSTGFSVTVTAAPGQLPLSSDLPATVTVQVRRSDNGQPPPNGTTVVVTTSLGSLGGVGGPSSAVLELVNGAAAVPLFPGTVAGSALIQASIAGSIGQARVTFLEADTFLISAVSPNVGAPAGGETVTILGSGFEDPVRVTFGGINAQVLSSSGGQIRVITPPSPNPANQVTTVDVAVTINVNEEDQATDVLLGAFTFTPGGGSGSQPAIFSLSPTAGPNEGGTRVTIVGDGFEAPVQVLFGQGTVSSFQGQEAIIESVTRDRITVISPAARGFGQDNLNQVVDILVRNLGSGLAIVRDSAFQYGNEVLITGVTPDTGVPSGGEVVTVHGQGFEAPVTVHFGGVQQTVLSVTGTEIQVRTAGTAVGSCANVTGTVSVTNLNTGDSANGPAQFTYVVPRPVITGVSPNNGSQNGGTNVTITGINFQSPVRVQFGNQAGNVTSSTSTTINVTTPAYSGTFPTQQCQAGDLLGTRQLPASVNVTVINLLTGCTDTLPNGFNFNPTDTSCQVEVPPEDGGGGGGGG